MTLLAASLETYLKVGDCLAILVVITAAVALWDFLDRRGGW